MKHHEDFAREDVAAPSSARSFGWVMAGAFGVIGLAPLLHGRGLRWWALLLAAIFAIAAALAPGLLTPLNRFWNGLARVLNRIASPVIMALLYCLIVVPTGMAMRLGGKDPLRLKLDRNATSYWQPRVPPGPAPGSLKQQF